MASTKFAHAGKVGGVTNRVSTQSRQTQLQPALTPLSHGQVPDMRCRRDLLVVLAVGASKGKARSPNDLLRRAGRLDQRV